MRERIPIGRIILGIVLIGGVLPVIAVAPGLGRVLKGFGMEKRLRNGRYIRSAVNRLKKQGYLTVAGEGRSAHLKITSTGKKYFAQKRNVFLLQPKRRAWDGYWRIVMFDIQESQRSVRDSLRRELAEVGFKKLQGSVWVSPDECEEYVKLLKADRRIGKRLIYLKTKDIEYGPSLRTLFKIERR